MIEPSEWQSIQTDECLHRLKVPCGWLVRWTETVIHDKSDIGRGMVGGWDYRTALAFVPDPTHEWTP